ncbi:MAG TPA: hypothetical protein PLH86_01410 [Saprospiraceae bacterium]|nr:hypothetical protein [Saprospiraceae bacterium]
MKIKLFYFICLITVMSCGLEDGNINLSEDNGNGKTSTNGSTSRFTIKDNYLYTIESNKLKVFDISISSKPNLINDLYIGNNIETIFSYRDQLYIGASTGIYIINIKNPKYVYLESYIEHWVARDPVVVKDDIIYSTARNSWSGQLNIYQKQNNSFVNLSSFRMNQPYGLGISDHYLYICDINDGLILFDVKNPRQIVKLKSFNDVQSPQDVIVLDKLIIVSTANQFFLFDSSDPINLKLIQQIK